MRIQKLIIFLYLIVVSFSCKTFYNSSANLNKISWIHGNENCKADTNAPIQIVRYNYNTFILRQNKCINYEGPFLFLFLGNKKALLMDTGATKEDNLFPLYKTVNTLISEWKKTINSDVELIVAHTHNHGDHKAGDIQFINKQNTTVLGLDVEDVKSYFKLENWPFQNSKIDLGNRVLEIIPIPGHQKASIAVYDNETNILLSGDSFYPGRLYVDDWSSYKLSIQRLTDFTQHHKISYILGNHIEMTNISGKDYPVGTTYQPDEYKLPLKVKDLKLLNKTLMKAGDKSTRQSLDKFIIYPK